MKSFVSTLTASAMELAAEKMEHIARQTTVFISMPRLVGITPQALMNKGRAEPSEEGKIERLYGIFRPDECGLPVFDHGLLYGDAVFEGVLSVQGRLFQWREHVERLYRSAERLKIAIPYTPVQLTKRLLEAMPRSAGDEKSVPYLRLVVTRGVGDLGINPTNCVGCTIYCIISQIQLYPESTYENGIHLALATKVRRSGPETVDPQVKSCNYLNNILALLETADKACPETLMLDLEGFAAEATMDNIFVVTPRPGCEDNPSLVRISTPAAKSCLRGITRELALGYARKMGFTVEETPYLIAEDFTGSHKEVFLTGTAAGLTPVTQVNGREVGDGNPGPITKKLREMLQRDFEDGSKGLSLSASQREIADYLKAAGSGETFEPPSADSMICRMFQTIDSRNWEKLPSFFCEDVVYERPGYPQLEGIERLMKFYREERVIVSGQHLLDKVIANPDGCATWGRFVGRHKNGSEIDERFADVYTFENGRIKTRRSFFFRPAV